MTGSGLSPEAHQSLLLLERGYQVMLPHAANQPVLLLSKERQDVTLQFAGVQISHDTFIELEKAGKIVRAGNSLLWELKKESE